MRKTMLSLFLVTAALSGCATAPKVQEFDRSSTYSDATFDQVWNAVIDMFGERNWAISNMEKASGFINTDWMRVNGMGKYLDCGNPGILTESNHMGRFNIVVRQEAGTKVTINTVWRAQRALGQTTTDVDCVSTGVLEGELHTALASKLRSTR